MKKYDPQLTVEQINILTSDSYNTKISEAGIQCNFKPQFSLLDKRGEVAKAFQEVFPDDGSKETDLEIEIGLDSVKVSNEITMTQSFIGLQRSVFNRQKIVPTTLPHFSKIAIEQLTTYERLFPDLKELTRFGYRVKQNNKIREEKIKTTKNKFANEFLGISSFVSKLKQKNAAVKFNDYNVIFNVTETLANSNKISEYFIRIQLGLVGIYNKEKISFSKEDNTNCNFYSDLDFSLKPSSDKPVLFENAIILCKRVSERADEIHQLILEMITDV